MKLAIDIGGTHLRSERYGDEGVEETASRPTSTTDLCEFIEEQIARFPAIDFVGISYAGYVSDGTIVGAPNIKVAQPAIKRYIESRHPAKLVIDNDLNCAVLAEAEAKRLSSVVALYAGTGLGCGAVDQGRVVRGHRNIACEIGHVPYRESPLLCGCGKSNCFELFASGSGIAKWCRHEGLDPTSTLQALKDSSDMRANTIANNFEEALSYAAAALLTLFNPAALVLGGGIIAANPRLVDTVKANLPRLTLPAGLEKTEICLTNLNNAPMQGAKLLERSLL